MSTQNSTEPQDNLNAVLEVIREIAEKSAGGKYIYRGEPQHYDKVCSSLYRQYEEDIEAEHFKIDVAQGEMLKESKDYIHETDADFEILTQLQHFGGKTNLIDFTTDYLVALFFACDGFFDKPGRMILLGEEAQGANRVKKPRRNVVNRVRDQKSIFARPRKGFIEIERNDTINIPKCLKQPILNYLEKYHDISTKTIYNDLHGFIKVQDLHQTAYTEFFRGVTCQNNNQHDSAIEHYTKAIALRPDFVEAYNNRGNAYQDNDDHDRAFADFNKAIELNPDFADAHYNRGMAYDNEGDYDRAIADYNKAIDLNPNAAEAYNNRGMAYYKKEDSSAAIADFTKAIQLKPDDAIAYNNRGMAYARQGTFSKAIADYTEAIALKSDYAEAYNNRGYVQRDEDSAIADYTEAIALKSDYAEAYFNRGYIYILKGNFDGAIADYTEAIKLKSDYAAAFNDRGAAYRDKEDYDSAIADFTKAIQLDPYPVSYFNRGVAQLALGEWENAKANLTAVRNMGSDIIALFQEHCGSVASFEERIGRRLPEDLAAMLTPQQ